MQLNGGFGHVGDAALEGDFAGLAQLLDDLHLEPDEFFAGVANDSPRTHDVPRSMKEARAGPDAHLWEAALLEELDALKANDVYEEVPTPVGVKPITSKVVMRIKFDADGSIERFKLWPTWTRSESSVRSPPSTITRRGDIPPPPRRRQHTPRLLLAPVSASSG